MPRSRAAVVAAGLIGGLVALGRAPPAAAWGDEGHEVIGLIAEKFLDPTVRARVNALLAGDATHLTASTRIDQEATWADRFRDSDRDTTRQRYEGTREWHYVDLELERPDLRRACFAERPLPQGTAAALGPARDCIVDKVDQFSAELLAPQTSESERRLALEFVLHLVGDIHQPLHASDDHDEGGNLKLLRAPGRRHVSLHQEWDTLFVSRLGANERVIAQRLLAGITDAQRDRWSAGTAREWALESFTVAKEHAYGRLPEPTAGNRYSLPPEYVSDAVRVTAEQLSKAGVRLAYVLNRTLGQPASSHSR